MANMIHQLTWYTVGGGCAENADDDDGRAKAAENGGGGDAVGVMGVVALGGDKVDECCET